jgi:hypothetical protein
MLKKLMFKRNNVLQNKLESRRIVIVSGVVILILYLASFATPRLSVIADIQAVTEKDYKIFVQNNDGNPTEKKTRENCRFFTVEMELKRPILFTRNMDIDYENLGGYMMEEQFRSNTVGEFTFLGSYSANDNGYHTVDGIDIYSEGMTDMRLYDFFGDYRIDLSWVDLFGRQHHQYYYLKDYYK